jgi:hypothetical protein
MFRLRKPTLCGWSPHDRRATLTDIASMRENSLRRLHCRMLIALVIRLVGLQIFSRRVVP